MATNWKKNQPIILYLRRWLPAIFPVVHQQHPGGRGVGGYNNRTTASGGVSDHAEGRAADIYLSAFDATQKKIGDGIFKSFRQHYRVLGIDHIIWNQQIWSASQGGPRPYVSTPGHPRRPHTDHVHVSFTRDASQLAPAIFIPILDGLAIELTGGMAGQERAPAR